LAALPWLNKRVPVLEKKPFAKGRQRAGDWLAVLLLLAILAGLGWLWWHEKHPEKSSPHKSPPTVPVNKNLSPLLAVPVVKMVEPEKPVVAPVPAQVAPPAVEKPNPVSPVISETDFPRPVRGILEAQIALARRAISPGSIDGAAGSQTRAAIGAFQRSENLLESGLLGTNTRAQLTLDAPVLADYTVTTNDLARLQPLGKTWLAKSQQSALEYETILECVAEKAHAHPLLVQKFNPGVDWTSLAAGTVLKIPGVSYPEPADKAAFVIIHLSGKFLEAFDADTNLLLHCPCSIAAKVEKRPVGELHVAAIAPHPNYTFDPAVFPESPEAQAIGHKLILPPGPNNPVGVAWISLDKPGYGMHGTPSPEQVGRTESHGCFRLANWDAEYLVKLVSVGMPVEVVP
jgi:lipoprotein-anchoring transpeptidase ErfK/SrfK